MPSSPPALSRRPHHHWRQVPTSVLHQHCLHRVRMGDHVAASPRYRSRTRLLFRLWHWGSPSRRSPLRRRLWCGAVVLCRPKRSACGCLRSSCPGDFPDNFYLEVLDRQHRRGRSLRASQGAWPPPGSNSMTLLLPCTHMLTRAALSHPHRSLASRRLQNYGRGSTTSRRAHAAATISAPPRTAASCTRSQAPSPGSSRCVMCTSL